MKIANDIFWRENGVKLHEAISKKDLASKLISKRIIEIANERISEEGWKPKLPIEKVLKRIFCRIPRFR